MDPSQVAGGHSSRSFSRLESSNVKVDPLLYGSAEAPENTASPDTFFAEQAILSPSSEEKASKADIFASRDESEDSLPEDFANVGGSPGFIPPSTVDELPIEVKSMTERFLDSLSAKVYPSPLSVNALSQMYQEFYLRASSQISVHIAALSTQLSRQKHMPRATSSRGSRRANPGSRQSSVNSRRSSDIDSDADEQQMLTATEVTDRKKARKLLDVKKVALEEAVERAVCEKLYSKLWRHRSTDDEERDQKLNSRIAALSLVGIGLKDLLESAEDITDHVQQITLERETEIRSWLTDARTSLQRMREETYPLGKLRHLKASHKSIVDTLSRVFPASSSADEILPALIFTLITASAESLFVISDLHFIQRFRASNKMDGEAAYCLVNLEAAITFIETVDLISLGAGHTTLGSESEETASKATQDGTVSTSKSHSSHGKELERAQAAKQETRSETGGDGRSQEIPISRSQNRLSNILQAQTNRIEAASDAVRESILDSADQAFDTINNTLENSFKFLFGRMKDQQTGNIGNTSNVMPKTLEDARKLVGSSAETEEEEIGVTNLVLERTKLAEGDFPSRYVASPTSYSNTAYLGRDRSVDSDKSSSRGRRIIVPEGRPVKDESMMPQSPPANAALESMRNLGSSLNPLNRFANMGMIPRFARSNTNSSAASNALIEKPKPPGHHESNIDGIKESRALAALEELRKAHPPIKKYLDLKDAQDIKIGDIDELLKDYQRLAIAMRAAIKSV